MSAYDVALAALQGADIQADILCRDGLIPAYAIIRLRKKSPRLSADDHTWLYQCTLEVKIYARSGLIDLAERAERAMRAAGFAPVSGEDIFDGEYQIATTQWTAIEEEDME